MQVTETLAQGLKREYRISVSASDLRSKLDAKLDDLKARANIPGFRPGKVPVAYLKRLYGKSAMAEIVNDTVTESTRKVANDNDLKLALEPKITFPEDEAAMKAVIDGEGDLTYTMAVEVLPKIEIGDFKTITLVKEVADVADDEVKAALARIADNNRPFTAKEAGAQAADGDKLTIDFKGSIDGELFQGGTAEGTDLVIGSNTFIPGFEPQLVGAKVGDDVEVKVTFPAEYQAAHLAGKDAVFAVKVHAIATPGDVQVDDEFARTLGMESLAKLEDAIRAQMSNDYAGVTRRKVKRKLLDALDGAYRFDLPEGLVEQEFEIIWRNLTSDMERASQTFEQEGTTEEKARVEYRTIAERRVRLGLLLAEVGDKGQIKVADDEVNRALFERARQFPGQERKVVEFYRDNPDALAQLRAPIFEEKVVDYILELATVTEQKVSKEALLKEDEDEKA